MYPNAPKGSGKTVRGYRVERFSEIKRDDVVTAGFSAMFFNYCLYQQDAGHASVNRSEATLRGIDGYSTEARGEHSVKNAKYY